MMKCARCNSSTVGKSKYCGPHKIEAKARFLEIVNKQSAEREDKRRELTELFSRAEQAGREAVNQITPTPMIVNQHEEVFNDNSPVIKQYVVTDGVCGFASVHITPGNCAAANFAKKYYGAYTGYYGGVNLPIHDYNQSYEKKLTHAQAFANVLRSVGIKASAEGRLD